MMCFLTENHFDSSISDRLKMEKPVRDQFGDFYNYGAVVGFHGYN